jgi:L-arabinokinase
MEQDYSAMQALYQLPFGHQVGLKMFQEVRSVPLVTGTAGLEVRHPFPAKEGRVIWLAMRGNLNQDAVRRAVHHSPDCLFLTTDEGLAEVAPNMRRIHIDSSLTVTGVIRVCHAVLGKLGYGLVSECVAAKVPLVHVPRTGFREDDITRQQAPRYTVLREMPVEDFHAGDWRGHLEAAIAAKMPEEACPAGGAHECARLIAGLL